MAKKILDMTCGSRTIWFDKMHPAAIYFDKRRESMELYFGKSGKKSKTFWGCFMKGEV